MAAHHVAHYTQDNLETFFKHHDYILASPGIDTAAYRDKAQFIEEVDLFCSSWHKQIIAITGTVGKTTITSALSDIVSKQMPLCTGGNIGIPMLDLLAEQQTAAYALLELSSWQLEHCTEFTPDIAIWTNLYENHLDRHKTMEQYFQAKARILTQQTKTQKALLPLTLRDQILALQPQAELWWITSEPTAHLDQKKISGQEHLVYVEHGQIMHLYNGSTKPLFALKQLPKTTFVDNWLYIIATLHLLAIPLDKNAPSATQLEHRLELVTNHNEIMFYNDSKATTPASTLAAVKQFPGKPILLFLGGLSKGIDRSTLIAQLPGNITHIICFGAEAKQLKRLCDQYGKRATRYDDLETAFESAMRMAQPQDLVLFCPAGSSFDLYTNYQERGNHFKQLVRRFVGT